MPIFASQMPDLRSLGPVINVQLSPTAEAILAMRNDGIVVPSPINASALIDTGASQSAIQIGVAQSLGLLTAGTRLVNTPTSHNFSCNQYRLRLSLFPTVGATGPVTFEGVFTDAPLKGKNFQCLIGRDVFANAVFTYIGPTNSFVLSF